MTYSLKNSDWEAYGQSMMYFEKEKNGDHLLLEDIKVGRILIATERIGDFACLVHTSIGIGAR